jgi:predicted O-methyltransferase YrrM
MQNTEDSNFYYDLESKNLLYLANLISHVTNTPVSKLNEYFNEVLNNEDLKSHINDGFKNSSYEKNAEVKFGRRIGWYAVARIIKPKIIVETGVDHGVGACVLIQALMENSLEGFNGKYFGTDIDLSAGQLLRGDYAQVGRVLYGDSLESLASMEEKVDLFINDSDHSSEYEYLEYRKIATKLTQGAVILSDNSHVTDSLARFSMEESRHFLFFREEPKNHWYSGAGIGISFK